MKKFISFNILYNLIKTYKKSIYLCIFIQFRFIITVLTMSATRKMKVTDSRIFVQITTYLANIHGKVRSQCRNPRHTFYEYPINKLDNLMNILAQYLYPCTVVKSVAY